MQGHRSKGKNAGDHRWAIQEQGRCRKAKAKECPKGTHSTTDKIKEKAQESVEKAKTAGDKIKDKIKEAIPVDKKK